jgi:acyl transferase domain-containing protein
MPFASTLDKEPRAMIDNQSDPIVTAAEKLETALAADVPGHEQEWTVRLHGALLALENALRGHKTAAEGQNGMFASLNELAPETLPTLDRQLQKLCEDHNDFLRLVAGLRDEAQNALRAFQPRLDKPGASAPHFTPQPANTGVPDFGAIRQQGSQFLETLRKHRENETKLLLETATTDVGVGD